MWESLVRIDLNFEGDLDVRPNICKDRSRERFNEDHDLLKMKLSHIKLKLAAAEVLASSQEHEELCVDEAFGDESVNDSHVR